MVIESKKLSLANYIRMYNTLDIYNNKKDIAPEFFIPLCGNALSPSPYLLFPERSRRYLFIFFKYPYKILGAGKSGFKSHFFDGHFRHLQQQFASLNAVTVQVLDKICPCLFLKLSAHITLADSQKLRYG